MTKRMSLSLSPRSLSGSHLCGVVLFLWLFCFPLCLAAQDTDLDKGETFTGNLVKVEGEIRCQKPDVAHSVEVPDRPGHALMLLQRQCTWTKPLAILDAKAKTGVAVDFIEKAEGMLHVHGFEVETLDNGEKLTMRTMGQVLAEKGPMSTKGRWSFMRGTGKFKGIKGGGTYEGTLEADDSLTLSLEGVYVPAEMVGEKK